LSGLLTFSPSPTWTGRSNAGADDAGRHFNVYPLPSMHAAFALL
jgi:hypothetical protein